MVIETIGAIVIAVAIVVGVTARFVTKQNDSVVEQAAEKVLKAKGIDIDFSPEDKPQAEETQGK